MPVTQRCRPESSRVTARCTEENGGDAFRAVLMSGLMVLASLVVLETQLIRSASAHVVEVASPGEYVAATAHVTILSKWDSYGSGPVTDPSVVNWMINTDGVTGSSVDAEIHELVSQILADVETVSYTDTFVYVETSGVPSYMTGPFPDGNPAYPSDLDATYRIPRSPQADSSGNNAEVGLGPQGVFINGVALFNYADGMSYNNQGIWNQDANFFEADGFDTAPGHPAPIGGGGPPGGGGALVAGRYHHHQNPAKLRDVVGDDGLTHSPILAFAFDGFPIYGPYGYVDPANPTSEIVRIESSYRLRDITQRTTLPDGTGLSAALYGPSLAEVELGAYQEDYVFDATSGDLDEYNGRVTITPDYPEGTYAYFVTLDEIGDTAFPHMLGPTFYGQVVSQQNIVIPTGAIRYVPSQPTNSGDFNYDGIVNTVDVDLLRTAINANSPDPIYDVNGGGLDETDFDYEVEAIIVSAFGDADLDKRVTFTDFVSLSNYFGSSGTGWGQGNFNLDDITNFEDFVILSNHYGTDLSSGVSVQETVPEPASLVLLSLAVGFVAKRRGVDGR